MHINTAIKQLINKDGVPFEITNSKPSKELIETLQEDIINRKIRTKSHYSVKELINLEKAKFAIEITSRFTKYIQ